MIKNTHYVPILKARAGELGALGQLSPLQKGSEITPLLEVNDVPSKHLAKDLVECWGTKDSLFLDLQTLPSSIEHAFADQLSRRDVKVIPVVQPRATAARLRSAGEIAEQFERGVCIRASWELFFTERCNDLLEQLPDRIGVSAYDTDLIVDFKDLVCARQDLPKLAISILSTVPLMGNWRSVIVAASSFPKRLHEVIPGRGIKLLPRPEWSFYEALQMSSISRKPAFSDYAVNHPDRSVGNAHFGPAANIRYTVPSGFLVMKADKRQGNGASRELSKLLINRPEYMGADFCAADREIAQCASGKGGVGSAWTWKRRDMRHHFEVVLNQLAHMPES